MISSVTLKIVVIGVGIIGPRHAKHVIENPHTDLFGIVDPGPAGPGVAKELKVDHFSSIQNMIQFCNETNTNYPDGAIVCTPNSTHVKVAAELASHGIHLLVEKPLSPSPAEAIALKNYVDSKGVKLLVGHHRRFNPHIVATKENLHKVGKIIAVQGTWTLRKPSAYFESATWRTDINTGGGVLMINLIHDIDLLQYMFGPIERVYAELLPKQKLQYPNVDEGAVLTIRFKSGTCGTFVCSDSVTSPFNFESGTGENPTIPHHEDLEGLYRIFGTEGTLSVPDFTLYHQQLNGECKQEEPSWLNPIQRELVVKDRDLELHSHLPFDLQLNHFVDVIRGNVDPFCSAQDGMSSLLCIEAVLKSIETELPQRVSDCSTIKPDYESLGLKEKLNLP